MENTTDLIARMTTDKRLIVRTPAKLSWGDRETCQALFPALFRKLDGSIAAYRHIP